MHAHELEESELNPIRCLPLEEKQHLNSFKELGVLYYSILNELNEKNYLKNFRSDLDSLKLEDKNGNLAKIEEKIKEVEKNDSGSCLCDHGHNKMPNEEKIFWVKENNDNNNEPGELTEKEKLEGEKSELPQFDDFFSLFTNKKENKEMNFSDQFSEMNANLSEFCLLCEKKKENEKHKHGPGCGHSIINHQGHIDYIVEGILHFPHDEHCDDHGKIVFI